MSGVGCDQTEDRPDPVATTALTAATRSRPGGDAARAAATRQRAGGYRRLLWRLPYRWLPNPKPTVWVVAFDPDDGHVVTQLRAQHPAFGLATGVVETPGRLWLGRIDGPTICYLDL
jgi:hypothetical protein